VGNDGELVLVGEIGVVVSIGLKGIHERITSSKTGRKNLIFISVFF
jgi:hypothetical protein